MVQFSDLADDEVLEVFKQLPLEDKFVARRVSRAWKDALESVLGIQKIFATKQSGARLVFAVQDSLVSKCPKLPLLVVLLGKYCPRMESLHLIAMDIDVEDFRRLMKSYCESNCLKRLEVSYCYVLWAFSRSKILPGAFDSPYNAASSGTNKFNVTLTTDKLEELVLCNNRQQKDPRIPGNQPPFDSDRCSSDMLGISQSFGHDNVNLTQLTIGNLDISNFKALGTCVRLKKFVLMDDNADALNDLDSPLSTLLAMESVEHLVLMPRLSSGSTNASVWRARNAFRTWKSRFQLADQQTANKTVKKLETTFVGKCNVFRGLEHISLVGNVNNAGDDINRNLGHIATFYGQQLKVLNVGLFNVKNESLEVLIANCRNLEQLRFGYQQEIELAPSDKLTNVNGDPGRFVGMDITDGLNYLSNLKKLRVLCLGYTPQLKDEMVLNLVRSLPSLERLGLCYCQQITEDVVLNIADVRKDCTSLVLSFEESKWRQEQLKRFEKTMVRVVLIPGLFAWTKE